MKICELFSSCKKSMGNEAQNQVNLKSQVHSHDSLVFAYLKKKVNNRKKVSVSEEYESEKKRKGVNIISK